MQKIIINIVLVLALVFVSSQVVYSQDTIVKEGYVLMKVKSDILDCPHFGYLLPQELLDKEKIELTKTDNKTYMLFKAKNYSELKTKEGFYKVVKEIQFPSENIVELILEEDYDKALELIDN